MFTALTLSLALGAPVPVPTAPVPMGVAPRVMELKANADGKITVTVTRMEKVQVGAGNAILPNGGPAAVPNGGPAAVLTRDVPMPKIVELGEVKDLAIMTADGKKLDKEEAMKKLAGGAVVVVSADGQPVSPAFLKVFKDDTLVLSSPELTAQQGGGFAKPGIRPLPVDRLPLPNGGIQILPIAPGGIQVLPAQPGVIQIQIAPAVLPVPVEKVPVEKNEK